MKNKQLLITAFLMIFLVLNCAKLNGEFVVASLQKFRKAQEVHLSKHGEYGNVQQLMAENEFDLPINSESYHNYRYEIVVDKRTYTVKAIPLDPNKGSVFYYLDETMKIRCAFSIEDLSSDSPELSDDSN